MPRCCLSKPLLLLLFPFVPSHISKLTGSLPPWLHRAELGSGPGGAGQAAQLAGSGAVLVGKLSSARDVVGVSVVQLEELSLMRGGGRSKEGVFENVCSAEIRSDLTWKICVAL